jgi:hypothetical protein
MEHCLIIFCCFFLFVWFKHSNHNIFKNQQKIIVGLMFFLAWLLIIDHVLTAFQHQYSRAIRGRAVWIEYCRVGCCTTNRGRAV